MYANRIGKYLPFRWLIQTRDHCSSLSDTSVINATCLTSRTIVSITGDETYDFLQGLVTNDVNVLRKDSNTRMNAIYSLMLNNNGRILYDLLLYDEPKLNNTVNIECDVTIVDQLLKLLKMYKLRKKLEIIDRSEDLKVLAVGFGDELNVPGSLKTLNNYVIDPRTIVMGYRMLIDRQSKVEDCIENVKMERESQYLKHKYKYGIAEGIKDLPIMKCFPLESNADYLNGVSFHKGCYIGQELTARTHHTGVVRKRIAPVYCPIDDVDLSLIEDGTPIVNEVNKNVGRFRAGKGKFGIATVRLDPVFNAKQLLINFNDKNIPLIVSRPSWWSDLKLKGFNPIQSEL